MKQVNGLLERFNPTELMMKVKTTGQSLHTVQLGKDNKEYIIAIFYEEFFGPKGIDNPDEKYWYDIVSEDSDGHQERLTTFEESRNLLDYEVVAKLKMFKEARC